MSVIQKIFFTLLSIAILVLVIKITLKLSGGF